MSYWLITPQVEQTTNTYGAPARLFKTHMETSLMSQVSTKKPLAIALGAAFVTSLAATPVANATANPFAMSELSSGYMVAEMKEGKCGSGKVMDESKSSSGMMMEEGKCGANKAKAAESSDKAKAEGKCGEAKCGGNKKMMEEGKCGGNKKMMEEGKCGGNKKMMEEGMSGGDAAGKEGN
jgi:uncharacterized low-complexity protein